MHVDAVLVHLDGTIVLGGHYDNDFLLVRLPEDGAEGVEECQYTGLLRLQSSGASFTVLIGPTSEGLRPCPWLHSNQLPFRATNDPLADAGRIEKRVEPLLPPGGRFPVDRIVDPAAVYHIPPRIYQAGLAEHAQVVGKQIGGQAQSLL
jgi:hypothetical protein